MTGPARPPRLPMPIVGRRILLRPPELRDVPRIAEALGDRRVTRLIPLPAEYSVQDARKFVRRARKDYREGLGYDLSIILRSTGQLIGGCRLHSLMLDQRSGHLGYWVDRPFWGQGYAPEAASLVITAGFRRLGLHRIHTGTFPENRRSMRVLRRLGFRVEGRAREAYFLEGRYWDSVRFGLLRPEFRPYRPPKS